MSTLIGCVNGAGQQVTPFFVFPGARIVVDGGCYTRKSETVSDSGWSNTDIFTLHAELFEKYLPKRSDENPVLVLIERHKSRVSLSLIEWTKSGNIILYVFQPHCSHLLQPLDMRCFEPFESAWNSLSSFYATDGRKTGYTS